MGVLHKIINLILPPRCLLCGKVMAEENGLCPDCFNQITFIAKPYCERCGLPFKENISGKTKLCGACLKDKKNIFRFSRSAFKYDDFSKKLILELKFLDKTENANVLARLLWNAGHDIFAQGADVLIPIPLHYTRLLKRRYNQSALLARALSKLCHLPCDFSSLERHKKTRPQVEFSGRARVKNVKDAFRVKNASAIKGKRIVLIDDVMTTGSTLRECALVLLKNGAASVDTLTVARVYE